MARMRLTDDNSLGRLTARRFTTRRVSRTAAGLLACLVLTTCNLFKAGLGPKVDVTPPEITISSPLPGAYVRGTVVLTGTAADDIGVTSLTVSYPTTGGGTVQKAATLTGKNWTVSVPSGGPSGLVDGKDTITITAKAASGKAATTSVLAYVDNTPPMVLVTTPTTYGAIPPIYSAYVDINGQAYDTSPVSSVSVTISWISKIIRSSRIGDEACQLAPTRGQSGFRSIPRPAGRWDWQTTPPRSATRSSSPMPPETRTPTTTTSRISTAC